MADALVVGPLRATRRSNSARLSRKGVAFSQIVERVATLAEAQRRRPHDSPAGDRPYSPQESLPWSVPDPDHCLNVGRVRLAMEGDRMENKPTERKGVHVAFGEGTVECRIFGYAPPRRRVSVYPAKCAVDRPIHTWVSDGIRPSRNWSLSSSVKKRSFGCLAPSNTMAVFTVQSAARNWSPSVRSKAKSLIRGLISGLHAFSRTLIQVLLQRSHTHRIRILGFGDCHALG